MAKKKSTRSTSANPREPFPQLFYRLHALLATVRSIAVHEDELCTLMNEAKTSIPLDRSAANELRELLAAMAGAAYGHDLQGASEALDAGYTPAHKTSAAKPPGIRGPARKAKQRKPDVRKPAPEQAAGSRRVPPKQLGKSPARHVTKTVKKVFPKTSQRKR